MPTPTTWVAALEELPPDSRGYRRVLRLHAVALPAGDGELTAMCGYAPRVDELRTDRPWGTVTPSGRCPLCDLQIRRSGVVDLTATEATRGSARGPRTRGVSRRG
jgi:hypothetical protein